MSLALFFASALAVVPAVPATTCTPQDRPWITMELLASEPAGDEAAQIVDVDARGCATVRLASFYRDAGLYRRQLDASELSSLRSELTRGGLLAFDTEAVEREIAKTQRERAALDPAADERFEVICGDTYRLSVDDGSGVARIQWYAPKETAARHPEVQALGDLVGMIGRLQKLAGDTRRERIAAVGP